MTSKPTALSERTFGWMIRSRRLVHHYEKRLDMSEAMIHVGAPCCSAASHIGDSQTVTEALKLAA